jgi:mannose-6-phosphate isomerase-like protein (cupin superfamily)
LPATVSTDEGSVVSYQVARADELQDIAYRQDTHMRPVRHHFGITAFGTNAWIGANAGDRLVPEHTEDPGNEELYVVLQGRARFEIDGEAVDVPQGSLVYVSPESNRTAFAEEAGTTVLAVGATAGKAYGVSGWELWSQFHPAYEAGEYVAVIERARPVVEASPYAAPLYNLACCEALAGRTEDAIGHLRTALERHPPLRELVEQDTDLDPLRGEPAFRELLER